MKKTIALSIILSFSFLFSSGQKFAVEADKNNILYCGIENPITIVVEGSSCKSILVKTNNGVLRGKDGKYIITPDCTGEATIRIYKKVNGKLKNIGFNAFRVHRIPNPLFRVGPASDGSKISKVVLTSQEYVRAELDDFDFDVHYFVDSFTVCVISADTCKYKEIFNKGNRISEELKSVFQTLKPGDILVFKNIYAIRPDKIEAELAPAVITIK